MNFEQRQTVHWFDASGGGHAGRFVRAADGDAEVECRLRDSERFTPRHVPLSWLAEDGPTARRLFEARVAA